MDITMAEEKKNIRKRILSLRNEIPIKLREEKSNKILQKLYGLELYKKTEVMLTYVDYQSEVITTPLIARALSENKKIFTPKVCIEKMESEETEPEEMEFYRITGMKDLAEGYKGIREPICGESFLEGNGSYKASIKKDSMEIADVLMVIPGVAFDQVGHRIGYGKGFYDRYLKRLAEAGIKAYKIALCYECQMISGVPYENHDIIMDMVITENGIFKKGDQYE